MSHRQTMTVPEFVSQLEEDHFAWSSSDIMRTYENIERVQKWVGKELLDVIVLQDAQVFRDEQYRERMYKTVSVLHRWEIIAQCLLSLFPADRLYGPHVHWTSTTGYHIKGLWRFARDVFDVVNGGPFHTEYARTESYTKALQQRWYQPWEKDFIWVLNPQKYRNNLYQFLTEKPCMW